MTTAADDPADEAAFEAFLAGRPVPEEAAGLAAFAGAVRATATQPGRPSAALADLLATGLLVDQSSPSTRTAPSAGSPPRRPRVRKRRFAMFIPALLAKLLAAGAVAQAATGAGVVLVVATGAGATGLLGTGVQDTLSAAVGADSGEETPQGDAAVTGDETVVPGQETAGSGDGTAVPGEVAGTTGETTAPVSPVQGTFDPKAWVADGPADDQPFGAWVSLSAHNDQLREWLRSQGMTFGSMVRTWAHKKGIDDADLAQEGVDLGDQTDGSSTAPVTSETAPGADDPADGTEVSTTAADSGSGRGDGGNGGNKASGGHEGSGGNAGGKSSGSGNGRGHN